MSEEVHSSDLVETHRLTTSQYHQSFLENQLREKPHILNENVFYLHCGGCYATLVIGVSNDQEKKDRVQAELHMIGNASHSCPCCLRFNLSSDGMLEFPDQFGRIHFVFVRTEIFDDRDPNFAVYSKEMDSKGHIDYSVESFKRGQPTYGGMSD